MKLEDFAVSKSKVLKIAHTETIKRLSNLPNGKLLADKYNTLVVIKPNVLRYGVLLPLIFKDFLNLETCSRRELFKEIHIQSLCIYALILELDSCQDEDHQNSLTDVDEKSDVRQIQQSLESDYQDELSKYRTIWQNAILQDAQNIFETQRKDFGFEVDNWVTRFNDSVKKASTTFIKETMEEKKQGRLEEKLAIATDKNQMIMAITTLLAPLSADGEMLYNVAQEMMLPIQLVDDCFDWWIDYQQRKYTTLLRNVPNWDMDEKELYVFLIDGGYFQEILNINIPLMSEIINCLGDLQKGKTLHDLFVTLRSESLFRLENIEKFDLLIKSKKGGVAI